MQAACHDTVAVLWLVRAAFLRRMANVSAVMRVLLHVRWQTSLPFQRFYWIATITFVSISVLCNCVTFIRAISQHHVELVFPELGHGHFLCLPLLVGVFELQTARDVVWRKRWMSLGCISARWLWRSRVVASTALLCQNDMTVDVAFVTAFVVRNLPHGGGILCAARYSAVRFTGIVIMLCSTPVSTWSRSVIVVCSVHPCAFRWCSTGVIHHNSPCGRRASLSATTFELGMYVALLHCSEHKPFRIVRLEVYSMRSMALWGFPAKDQLRRFK